ncbi:hypothetical protein J4409_02675 [Candidatus Woesearchaeota archaeon]|nr:hypothetical protein [Candidatus Woesearchaeota archaeon]
MDFELVCKEAEKEIEEIGRNVIGIVERDFGKFKLEEELSLMPDSEILLRKTKVKDLFVVGQLQENKREHYMPKIIAYDVDPQTGIVTVVKLRKEYKG